jgi:glucose/mannose-6-phosphate isomerase
MNPETLEPPYGARDPRGMAALVDALPDHVHDALARTDAEPWPAPAAPPDLLAVGGMGGSAIAGELTAALFADRLPRPMLVVRDYRWPACVGPGSLVLLSSNSGHTEETLALADEAARRGVPAVALASGGALAERAGRHGWPLRRVPSGMPPRAALFHAWVPVSRLPAALGWAEDPAPAWREAAVLLAARGAELGTAVSETSNPAKRLARALQGRSVLVYAASGPMAAVAVRWRQQLNENAKLHAHSAAVPELNHNEIVGWQRPRPAHDAIALVVLRDREDSAEATLRLDLTAEYAARQGAAVHDFRSAGDSRLARMVSLVQMGDHLSLHLALLGGVDPTDITSIDDFKRRLAEKRG